jgi:protein-L-isoaspartate(D-aspartate) O-methyltransferase
MSPAGPPAPDRHADPSEPARRRMVDEQLVARGIRDARVLDAMRTVPRHVFVNADLEALAYDDRALPAAEGQTISQPWIVARMLELATLPAGGRVLEVGTGTGYQTALLARLVGHVYSVERLAPLVHAARRRLETLGVGNVTLLAGDGSMGWQEFAPYARVLAAAAAPHVPKALLEQLEEGGVLVVPVGGTHFQRLEAWRREGSRFLVERHGECRFVPLIGHDAWSGEPPEH